MKHTVWRGTARDGHYGYEPGIGPRNDIVYPHPRTGYPVSVVASEAAQKNYYKAWGLETDDPAALPQLWRDEGIRQCVPDHWTGPPIEETL